MRTDDRVTRVTEIGGEKVNRRRGRKRKGQSDGMRKNAVMEWDKDRYREMNEKGRGTETNAVKAT